MFIGKKRGANTEPTEITFSESVQAAMDFICTMTHGRLSTDLLKEARLHDAFFFGKPLVSVNLGGKIKERPLCFERGVEFCFGKEKRYVYVEVRKQKEPDAQWRVVEVIYKLPDRANASRCLYYEKHYRLVVEPEMVDGKQVTKSGFVDHTY